MIGVYDSGFGGLSVLVHLRRALPRHDLLYLGDSGRAPYGGRDVHTILDFAEQATERLIDEGARLVVVACNTVSCVALRHLQRRYAGPGSATRILGVTIPGAEAAVRAGPGRIGVLATSRTVASGTYVTEIHKLDPSRSVVQLAAPLLAPIVEEGWEATEIARLAAERYLADLGDVDTILLGCTHYPLLLPILVELVGGRAALVDPAPYLAERLVDWLARHPGFDAPGSGILRVSCTGDPDRFAAHGARFLGEPLPEVEPIAEVDGRLAPRHPDAAPTGQVVR
ncbi:MAG: glutamate racemase [Myxococcota bacterium]